MRTLLSSHENSCSFVGNLCFFFLEGFIVFFILDSFHEFVSFVAQWDLSTPGRMALTSVSTFLSACFKGYSLSILVYPSGEANLLAIIKKIPQNLGFGTDSCHHQF